MLDQMPPTPVNRGLHTCNKVLRTFHAQARTALQDLPSGIFSDAIHCA